MSTDETTNAAKNPSSKAVIERTPAPIMMTGDRGILMPRDFADAVKMADMMARANGLVPQCFIGNSGACLGIVIQAVQWGLNPYSVAQKAYIAKEGQPVAYESQLVHAVILKCAPLKGRLEHEIVGKGDDRQCKVWATLKGEDKPREFLSETLRALRPASGDRGVKGSPLWTKKPELQLFYNASRDWARMYCPDVLLGAYTIDEIRESIIIETAPVKMIDPFAGDGPRQIESMAPGAVSSPAPVNSEAAGPGDKAVETAASVSSSDTSGVADQPDVAGAPKSRVGAPALSLEEIARMDGKDAQASGREEKDNPHPPNSPEWLAWIEGFHDAEVML